MDVSQLLSARSTPSCDDIDGNTARDVSIRANSNAKAKAAALASFEPKQSAAAHLTPFSSNQSLTPYARQSRRGCEEQCETKRSGLHGAGDSTRSGSRHGKESPVKRIRKRTLSAKQKQRWLEKEADNSQIYNLTLDVNELKQQLQCLEVQKSLYATKMLIARQNLSGGALRTVDMFFKLFHHGLREWNEEEANFVYSCTDEQVALGTAAVGRHMLLDQWESYTKLFQIRSFVNSSMDLLSMDPDCVIVQCNGQFEGRLSRQAIEAVFPHILGDEELMARVMESKSICPAKTLLYFDASGRIVRYDAHADIFEGLNMLLIENPRDVITMMANARINDASMIPSIEESGNADSNSSSSAERSSELDDISPSTNSTAAVVIETTIRSSSFSHDLYETPSLTL